MGTAILGLLGVSLAAALAELLLPADEGRGTKTALRLLVSLAVLLLLLRPLLPLLHTPPTLFFEELVKVGEEDTTAHYQEIFENAVAARSESDLVEGLYGLLSTEYGIAKEDAYIKVHFAKDHTLSRVEIYLSGRALLQDPDQLAAEIAARLGCETEVR